MVITDNAKHVFLTVAKLMFTKHYYFRGEFTAYCVPTRNNTGQSQKIGRKIAGFPQETMRSIFKGEAMQFGIPFGRSCQGMIMTKGTCSIL